MTVDESFEGFEGAAVFLAEPGIAEVAFLFFKETRRDSGDLVGGDFDAGPVLAAVAGTDPWREINSIVDYIRETLGIGVIGPLNLETVLVRAPRSDEEEAAQPKIIAAAVLGLFPASKQALIDDVEAMVAGEQPPGPIQAFLHADPDKLREVSSLAGGEGSEAKAESEASGGGASGESDSPDEANGLKGDHFVASADPCQARSVRLARETDILVVHGPPGTGLGNTPPCIKMRLPPYLAHPH